MEAVMRAGGAYRKPGGKGWAAPAVAQQSQPAWTCLPASRYQMPLANKASLLLRGSLVRGRGS